MIGSRACLRARAPEYRCWSLGPAGASVADCRLFPSRAAEGHGPPVAPAEKSSAFTDPCGTRLASSSRSQDLKRAAPGRPRIREALGASSYPGQAARFGKPESRRHPPPGSRSAARAETQSRPWHLVLLADPSLVDGSPGRRKSRPLTLCCYSSGGPDTSPMRHGERIQGSARLTCRRAAVLEIRQKVDCASAALCICTGQRAIPFGIACRARPVIGAVFLLEFPAARQSSSASRRHVQGNVDRAGRGR